MSLHRAHQILGFLHNQKRFGILKLEFSSITIHAFENHTVANLNYFRKNSFSKHSFFLDFEEEDEHTKILRP